MAEAAAPEAALKRLQAWRECYCSYKGRMRNQDGLGRVWESEFRAENKGGPLTPKRMPFCSAYVRLARYDFYSP